MGFSDVLGFLGCSARTGGRRSADAVAVAVAQGAFNVVGGLWPLLHLRSFEWVFGPKSDVRQRTTGGLPLSAGLAQLAAAPDPGGPAQAVPGGIPCPEGRSGGSS